jgi:hypothetical protein
VPADGQFRTWPKVTLAAPVLAVPARGTTESLRSVLIS